MAERFFIADLSNACLGCLKQYIEVLQKDETIASDSITVSINNKISVLAINSLLRREYVLF